MAYNTKHFDHDAHYASKSTKQLEELVKFWEVSIAHYHGIHTLGIRELAVVKMKLAERIGKKQT
jgi:hypothetical protein